MDCELVLVEPIEQQGAERRYFCPDCEQYIWADKPPKQIHVNCSVKTLQYAISLSGVGTELHKLITTLGFSHFRGCKCAARIRAMNERGVKWCENNIALIVQWLTEAARSQDVLLYKASPTPVWKAACKELVKQAIRNAKNV